MELLGIFAHQAAIAVEQARLVGAVGTLLVEELGRLADARNETEIAAAADAVLSNGNTTEEQTLQLARLVHRISQGGERQRALALEILGTVQRYMR
jgi:GAF domain-containing protein